MPPVDSERQGTPHPRVVKRRADSVKSDRQIADPRSLAYLYAVARDLYHLVAFRRAEAAELCHDATALHCFHLDAACNEIGPIPVDVRLSGHKVFVPALPSPMVPFYVLYEDERPAPEHVRLWK